VRTSDISVLIEDGLLGSLSRFPLFSSSNQRFAFLLGDYSEDLRGESPAFRVEIDGCLAGILQMFPLSAPLLV
jgi:hypothetical protein